MYVLGWMEIGKGRATFPKETKFVLSAHGAALFSFVCHVKRLVMLCSFLFSLCVDEAEAVASVIAVRRAAHDYLKLRRQVSAHDVLCHLVLMRPHAQSIGIPYSPVRLLEKSYCHRVRPKSRLSDRNKNSTGESGIF